MSSDPISIPRRGAHPAPSERSDRDGHQQQQQQQAPLKLQTRRGSRSAPDPWSLGPLSSAMASAESANGAGAGGTPSPGSGSIFSSSVGATGAAGNSVPLAPAPSTGASRITIVRVLDDPSSAAANAGSALDAGDLSDGSGGGPAFAANPGGIARPGRSNSWGSNYSATSNSSSTATGGRSHSPGAARRPGGRMTFAFTSFTPINPPAPSPTQERGRPYGSGSASTPATPGNVSPTHTYSPGAAGQPGGHNIAGGHKRTRTFSNPALAPIKPSLTAQQIYELAMSSTNAPPTPSLSASAELAAFGGGPGGSGFANTVPSSPIHTTNAGSASLHRSHSHSRPTTPGLTGVPPGIGVGERTTPAVFRPMPDEVYLPFIDRPAEVSALLSEYPTSRLFQLLEALFPTDMKHQSRPSSRAAYRDARDEHHRQYEENPADWSFDRLAAHLKETTRAELDDKAWTDAARACIRGRSEALWERFKGALGVPAELEMDDDHLLEDGDEESVGLIDGHELAHHLQQLPPPGGVAESEGVTPGTEESSAGLALTQSSVNLAAAAAAAGVTFPPVPREAILEPVFADQSDSDSDDDAEDSEPEKLAPDAEAKLLDEAGDAALGHGEGITHMHFPNLSSGALSEGGWSSGRVMENIGEDEEDEHAHHAHHHHQHAHAHQHHHGDRQQRPRTPTSHAEFEDFGFNSNSMSEREIRALQITTAPSVTSPSTIADTVPLPLAAGVGPAHFRTGTPGPASTTGAGDEPSPSGASVGAGTGGEQPGPSSLRLTTSHLTHAGESVASPNPLSAHVGHASPSPPTNTGPDTKPSTTAETTSPTLSAEGDKGAGTGAITPRVILRRPSESIAKTLSASASSSTSKSPNVGGAGGLPSSSGSSGGYRGFGGYGLAQTSGPYHPALSERGPGNPLFPSSFAGLSVGPTLVANIPKSSRSGSISHYPVSLTPSFKSLTPSTSAPAVGPPSSVDSHTSGKERDGASALRRYASQGDRRAMRSTWADVRDRYEYAVTLASASSDGGRG